MLVTVVTPCLNQSPFLEDAIQSVLQQDYPHVEYIVVDGGSTDRTHQILEKYSGRLKWISGQDTGQSHAINRGFSLANGEILAWLNADDCYAHDDSISQVVSCFSQNPQWAFLYGDALAINRSGRVFGKRTNTRQTDFDRLLLLDDNIVQPAAFWRTMLWQEVGPLREDLRYVMDYDYWLRIAKHYPLHHIPVVLAKERLHGGTKTSSGKLERWDEMEYMIQEHGGEHIPLEFRAEKIATYLLSSWPWKQRRWREHPSGPLTILLWSKVLIYCIAAVVAGKGSTAYLRLLDSYLRGRGK